MPSASNELFIILGVTAYCQQINPNKRKVLGAQATPRPSTQYPGCDTGEMKA